MQTLSHPLDLPLPFFLSTSCPLPSPCPLSSTPCLYSALPLTPPLPSPSPLLTPCPQAFVLRAVEHPLNYRRAPTIILSSHIQPSDKAFFGYNRPEQTGEVTYHPLTNQ